MIGRFYSENRMVGMKERRTVIKLRNLGDMWNCSRLHKVVLLALLYLSRTQLEGLGMSGKGLREIMRTEVRSLRTVSMIASSHGQCHEVWRSLRLITSRERL